MGTVYTLPVCPINFVNFYKPVSSLSGNELSYYNWMVNNGLRVIQNDTTTIIDRLTAFYFASYSPGIRVAFYVYDTNQLGVIYESPNKTARMAMTHSSEYNGNLIADYYDYNNFDGCTELKAWMAANNMYLTWYDCGTIHLYFK